MCCLYNEQKKTKQKKKQKKHKNKKKMGNRKIFSDLRMLMLMVVTWMAFQEEGKSLIFSVCAR